MSELYKLRIIVHNSDLLTFCFGIDIAISDMMTFLLVEALLSD